MIKYFFWRLFRRPQVGDVYVHEDDLKNPYDRWLYTVKDVEGDFAKCDFRKEVDPTHGITVTRELRNLVAFYKRVDTGGSDKC